MYTCVFCACIFRDPGCKCIWLENTVSVRLSNYGFSCFCKEHFTGLLYSKIATLGILFTQPVQWLNKEKGTKMVPAVCAKDIRFLIMLVSCFSDVCVFAQMHILFRGCREKVVQPGSHPLSFYTSISIYTYIFLLLPNWTDDVVHIACL